MVNGTLLVSSIDLYQMSARPACNHARLMVRDETLMNASASILAYTHVEQSLIGATKTSRANACVARFADLCEQNEWCILMDKVSGLAHAYALLNESKPVSVTARLSGLRTRVTQVQ